MSKTITIHQTTTEDLITTIACHGYTPEAVECAREYLRRCSTGLASDYFGNMARAILARAEAVCPSPPLPSLLRKP